jgi:hypothetical protein
MAKKVMEKAAMAKDNKKVSKAVQMKEMAKKKTPAKMKKC